MQSTKLVLVWLFTAFLEAKTKNKKIQILRREVVAIELPPFLFDYTFHQRLIPKFKLFVLFLHIPIRVVKPE